MTTMGLNWAKDKIRRQMAAERVAAIDERRAIASVPAPTRIIEIPTNALFWQRWHGNKSEMKRLGYSVEKTQSGQWKAFIRYGA
jgi:hypothetical protein